MSQITTLCVTSDVHATVLERSYADGQIKPYGLSRYLSALSDERKQHPVITLDNGDILQGSPIVDLLSSTTPGTARVGPSTQHPSHRLLQSG
jgi:2',3'-cyclic-nucleotide 2'-phosphodiesterase (5'-nucleotidase family)